MRDVELPHRRAPPYNGPVAMSNTRTPFGSGTPGSDHEAVIVAEGVSKRYPVRRVSLFPPVLSMFQRGWFSRSRSAEEPATGSEQIAPVAPAALEPAQMPPEPGPAPPPQQRRPYRDDYDDVEDDEFDEDDDDVDEERTPRAGSPSPTQPGEMFWALKDVSFSVPRGAALGVLGGPGAGKSTLLNILGGQAFPTAGRVLVGGRVSPLHSALAKALSLTDKGTFNFDLVLASRLLGVEAHLVKRCQDEIEELAQPILNSDGDLEPGAFTRLAVAAAAVLPADVILLEDGARGMDEPLMARIIERVRKRLRSGDSLVFASRGPELAQQLCDEVIVLDSGSIVDRGAANSAGGRFGASRSNQKSAPSASSGNGARPGIGAGSLVAEGTDLDIPRVVPAFNGSAALLSATLQAASGRSKQIEAAIDEVFVEIHLETALPGVEARCGVTFAPRNGEGPGIRLEPPEPFRFVDPGSYVLTARTLPGALRIGAYEVRADAVVANPAESRASVIARSIGRVRIIGDENDAEVPSEVPTPNWDGQAAWPAEAEWSIE